MKRNELVSQLSNAGLASAALASPGGGSVVVTPHGGRILGLFTSDAGENFFFVNPELANPQAAKAMLAGVHVLGGDRLWLAPERGLFFKGNQESDGQTVQTSIDPGNWIIAGRSEAHIKLCNQIDAAYFHIPGSRLRGTCDRLIRAIANPLAFTGITAPPLADVVARTRYAGYEIASSFRMAQAPSDELYVGLWFLIQLAVTTPGYIYVPTTGDVVVTGNYYEPTGPDYLRVQKGAGGHVRFKLDSMERHKIGIRKTDVLGRGAFLSNESRGQATLVVRNFLNDPSGVYADVPLHSPHNGGMQDSVQAYNHRGGPQGFGEIEFHTPGICRNMPGEAVIRDVNQVWAFTGARADLVEVAAYLLNLDAAVFAV